MALDNYKIQKKAIIVGSGISGISISKMLQAHFSVLVVEKTQKIGGLIKCERINGNLFHLVGGHVFNSKNQTVHDWFWNYFDPDNDFLKTSRKAKILLNNEFIGYPLENFIYQLPHKYIKPIIQELLLIAAQKINPQESGNFAAFLKQSFGQTLYNIYFEPYNTKLWNTDLDKIPLEWLSEKLPMPDIQDILINNILKKDEDKMVHATFYYPVRDGSQFIINRLAEGITINTAREVSSIQFENGTLLVDGNTNSADFLIYSGDVRKLSKIINIEDKQLISSLRAVEGLLSNGTSNVLCETDTNDISWLYLPEKKFKAHRIIYTGNFSPTNNEGTGRRTCVVEFSGKQVENEMAHELTLLPGNLKALSYNYQPDSYIIQQNDTKQKINILKAQLEKYNIYLLGRFAEWEYYNMDKCIEAAMKLSSALIKKYEPER